MECRAFAAGGLAQRSPSVLAGPKLNKHFHIKLDCVIITTCLKASKKPRKIY